MSMDISYKYPWIIQKGGQIQGRKRLLLNYYNIYITVQWLVFFTKRMSKTSDFFGRIN